MTKIKTSNTTKGRPGFKTRGAAVGQSGGGLIAKSVVGVRSVKRLFARDPSKGNALIGSSKDVNYMNENINTVGAQNPRILRQPRAGTVQSGTEKVVDRSANRSVRKLK